MMEQIDMRDTKTSKLKLANIDSEKNPSKLDSLSVSKTGNFDAVKTLYRSTEVDSRTWLHVLSGSGSYGLPTVMLAK